MSRKNIGEMSGDEARELARAYRYEIRKLTRNLEEKNKALDAMWWVWCSGGCPGGVQRYAHREIPPLTEEVVIIAENNVNRLRNYYEKMKVREDFVNNPVGRAPEVTPSHDQNPPPGECDLCGTMLRDLVYLPKSLAVHTSSGRACWRGWCPKCKHWVTVGYAEYTEYTDYPIIFGDV